MEKDLEGAHFILEEEIATPH